METQWERVHTVTDYHDGPRGGVAEFMGRPVIYQAEFDDVKDEWADTFLLLPISDEVFQLALEDWEIWQRWKQAFDAGRTNLNTHPALPEDRKRYEEIASALTREQRIMEEDGAFRAKGEFKPIGAELKVQWREGAVEAG